MENLGLNNNVIVGGRKFHVQTSFSESQSAIVSNVFNDGQVIECRKIDSNGEAVQEEIESRLSEIHQEVITDLEILYYIRDKVSTVRHAASANKLGLLFLKKNLYQEATEQFRLALSIDPNMADSYSNLGKTLLYNDEYDEAVSVLREGVQKAPQYADIHNYLGIALLYKEEFEPALTSLEEAVKLNENYIGAHYHLGIAHAAIANAQEEGSEAHGKHTKMAAQHFDGAAERASNHQIANYDKVMEMVAEGNLSGAVEEFLLSKPRDVLSHFFNIENEFYLKFMYGGKGKDDTFISGYVEQLREILDENPDYADVRNNLGVANLIQCRNLFLKALDEFRAALQINPGFKKAEKNLKLAENDGKGFLILLRAILK